MDIPDTEFWCLQRAAMWVATRRSHICNVQMQGKGDDPYNIAWTWLYKNKAYLQPEFKGYFRANAPGMARSSPLDLAINEIVQAVWNGHLAIYEGELEMRVGRFGDDTELRDWLLDNRFSIQVQAKAVVLLWPRQKRGRPPEGELAKRKKEHAKRNEGALLVKAVDDLTQTGLTQMQACEKLRPCSRSAAALLQEYKRAKGSRR
jgi:hypothetical protein